MLRSSMASIAPYCAVPPSQFTRHCKASQDKEDGKEPPLPPPELTKAGSSSSSVSKMSPGLAARMGKAIPIPMPGGKQPCFSSPACKMRGEKSLLCCVLRVRIDVGCEMTLSWCVRCHVPVGWRLDAKLQHIGDILPLCHK